MRNVFALAVALTLVSPLLAWGDGFRWARTSVSNYYYPAYAPSVSYYYPAYAPAVSYYYPAYVPPAISYYPAYLPAVTYEYVAPAFVAPVGPACVTPGDTQSGTGAPPLLPEYATPSAAPPSRSLKAETGLSAVSDQGEISRPYYDTYSVARRSSAQFTGDRAEVGFWNLTDRDLTLHVDGQNRILPRGKNLPLALGREFVWQIDGREPRRQTLEKDQSALEIVIRR
jgi:hypothetical protein